MRPAPRVLVALITPFDDEAHRHNLELLAQRGVEGFVIGGSTGQGPYLLPGERERMVTIGRGALGEEPFIMCGIQAESVDQARTQIEEAANGGADTALVMTPTSLVRGKDELVALFYRTLADASSLPIVLYSVPATTGYTLPIEIAADLATHPNVVGMKDSGGDVERVPKLLFEGGFKLFAGSSRAVYGSAMEGAHGAITASANYASGLVAAALDDASAQERLSDLSGAIEGFGLAGTYAAAEATGLVGGPMRLPLQPLDDADRTVVASLLD